MVHRETRGLRECQVQRDLQEWKEGLDLQDLPGSRGRRESKEFQGSQVQLAVMAYLVFVDCQEFLVPKENQERME